MNIHLTRSAYEALPKRAELLNDPLTGQMYRDQAGGIVIARMTAPSPGNRWMRSLEWDAFGVTIEEGA